MRISKWLFFIILGMASATPYAASAAAAREDEAAKPTSFDAAECIYYAEANPDAVAQGKTRTLILCHKALSHGLDCREALRSSADCASNPFASVRDEKAGTEAKKKEAKQANKKSKRRINVALANVERGMRRHANNLAQANESRAQLLNTLTTSTPKTPTNSEEPLADPEPAPVPPLPGTQPDAPKPGEGGRPPGTPEEQRKAVIEQMVKTDAELKWIERHVAFSERKLFVNSEDYEDYFFRLNTGYEFISIDKLFAKGTPRIALLVNSKLFGKDVNDRTIGRHFYGLRFNFAALLNSSAEVTPTLGKANSSSDATEDKVKQTLGVEFQTVVTLARTRLFSPNNLRGYFSLITSLGGIKTDSVAQTTGRYYGGIRTSINPELYSDFLIGRTKDLNSLRFEFRSQLPMYTLESGDRIFLGAIFNVGIKDRRAKESDVYRIYVSWNTDLKKLFTTSSTAM